VRPLEQQQLSTRNDIKEVGYPMRGSNTTSTCDKKSMRIKKIERNKMGLNGGKNEAEYRLCGVTY
jgi:hypothetical protein